jgi:hypothetical protein
MPIVATLSELTEDAERTMSSPNRFRMITIERIRR